MAKVCRCSFSVFLCQKVDDQNNHMWWFDNTGSTLIIVVPLHTIEAQLVLECERLGIPAMAGSQVTLKYFSWKKLTSKLSQIVPKEFDAAMASRPRLLVCSVEFLADPEVDRDYPNLSVFSNFPRCGTLFWRFGFPLLERVQLSVWTKHKYPVINSILWWGPNQQTQGSWPLFGLERLPQRLWLCPLAMVGCSYQSQVTIESIGSHTHLSNAHVNYRLLLMSGSMSSYGVSDMWQWLSSTPGHGEGKQMKKSLTTSQVKMIARILIIDKRFVM